MRSERMRGSEGETGAERVLTRRCQQCREPFAPVRPHQHYCRPSCRLEAFKARQQRSGVDVETTLFRVPFE
jgi:hypothetical protein